MNEIDAIIVDDEEIDRYVANRVLSKDKGIGEVAELFDGSDALELLTSDEFDLKWGPHPPATLILLDINMPRMGGFELLEALAEHDEQRQIANKLYFVVMLTSSAHTGDKDRANSFDMVKGFIEKPITAEKLTNTLLSIYPGTVVSTG